MGIPQVIHWEFAHRWFIGISVEKHKLIECKFSARILTVAAKRNAMTAENYKKHVFYALKSRIL